MNGDHPAAPLGGRAAEATGGPRRRRRVVALSDSDRRRVERGQLPEDRAEQERRRGLDALTDARSREDLGGGSDDRAECGNDARLLGDVPPHWA